MRKVKKKLKFKIGDKVKFNEVYFFGDCEDKRVFCVKEDIQIGVIIGGTCKHTGVYKQRCSYGHSC